MQEKIIDILRKSDGYLSGEEISKNLHISRAGIWKYIQELRNDGYDIVAVPHLGYKLVSCPDKLFPGEIQFDLKTKTLGKRIAYFDTLVSTMDTAFELASQGSPEGTAVIAEGQTKGRGRLGRSWVSPKGKGIYLSVILRPKLAPNEVARLTLLCAVGICDAIKEITGLCPFIKWPNDVIVSYKKVGGILTELSAEADRVKFVVIGIGMNVNAVTGGLPEGATSLRAETKRMVSRVALTKEILWRIEKLYFQSQKGDFSAVIERWKDLSFTLNKYVRVVDAAGTTQGEAINIDEDGGLLIRKDSGVVVKKMAGDVVQVR